MEPDLWLCVSHELETIALFEHLHHFIVSAAFDGYDGQTAA